MMNLMKNMFILTGLILSTKSEKIYRNIDIGASSSNCPLVPQANCVSETHGLDNCGSAGTVRCLGITKLPSQCEILCVNKSTNTTPCHSWAFYYPDTPQVTYRGNCFGRFDNVWNPRTNIPPERNHVVSAKSCQYPPKPGPSPPPPGPPPAPAPLPPPIPRKPPAPVDPDLLPVAFLGGEVFNSTSTGDLNVSHLCKFQVVAVINSYCWQARGSNHNLCTNHTNEVHHILEASRMIKQQCPGVLTQMYLNSLMNFWWYPEIHQRFTGLNESLLLHDKNGKLVHVMQDGGNPNMTVFDWGQNATRRIFLETVDAALASGITSFFLDKADKTANSGEICNHVCAQLDPSTARAWTSGHYDILRTIALKSSGPTVGNGGLKQLLPIMGGAGADGYRGGANAAAIESLKLELATPHANSVFAHFPFNRNGYAAFLIGYTHGRSFLWTYQLRTTSMWIEEFERPMGKPLADAVLGKDGVYVRRFTKGNVSFDSKTNKGHFEWI